MADIFISWGSPDKDAVGPLVLRLKDLGLDCFEYTDEMRAGEIAIQVLEEIHKAKLAVMCVSDETVAREWFSHELAWCYDAERDDKHPMKALIFVGVGQPNMNKLPDLIRGRFVYDLAPSSKYEKTITRLIKDIYGKLDCQDPLVIGATIFAMTNKDCSELSQFKDQLDHLTNLCQQAGIGHLEDWIGSFPSRYGHAPEAFAPFSKEETIKDIVHDILRHVNKGRPKTSPIFVRWYDRQLLAADSEEGDCARDEWRSESHMIIIDSVSLLINAITADLVSILSLTRNEMRRALVWIPPFTRQAKYLHDLITRIEKPMPLRSLLQDWQTRPDCYVTFDTATNVSLRRWLNNALRDLASPPSPLASNLADLKRHVGEVAITPAAMYRAAGSRY